MAHRTGSEEPATPTAPSGVAANTAAPSHSIGPCACRNPSARKRPFTRSDDAVPHRARSRDRDGSARFRPGAECPVPPGPAGSDQPRLAPEQLARQPRGAAGLVHPAVAARECSVFGSRVARGRRRDARVDRSPRRARRDRHRARHQGRPGHGRQPRCDRSGAAQLGAGVHSARHTVHRRHGRIECGTDRRRGRGRGPAARRRGGGRFPAPDGRRVQRPERICRGTDLRCGHREAVGARRPRHPVHVDTHADQAGRDDPVRPLDGRFSRRAAPPRQRGRSPRPPLLPLPLVAVHRSPTAWSSATLLLWHVIGANTSDDGYMLNMARVSERRRLHGQLLPVVRCPRGAVRRGTTTCWC